MLLHRLDEFCAAAGIDIELDAAIRNEERMADEWVQRKRYAMRKSAE
jgi:hypothetical protein